MNIAIYYITIGFMVLPGGLAYLEGVSQRYNLTELYGVFEGIIYFGMVIHLVYMHMRSGPSSNLSGFGEDK